VTSVIVSTSLLELGNERLLVSLVELLVRAQQALAKTLAHILGKRILVLKVRKQASHLLQSSVNLVVLHLFLARENLVCVKGKQARHRELARRKIYNLSERLVHSLLKQRIAVLITVASEASVDDAKILAVKNKQFLENNKKKKKKKKK
jgi:hypothetical protein